MKNAEKVMSDFMQKLNNNKFIKDTCPQTEDGFYPNEKTIDEKLNKYQETLEHLENLL